MTVLENRSRPVGRRLRLAVAILKSLSRTPRPDPVVRIGGGPGDPAVTRTPSIVTRTAGDAGELIHALRADRDVILYDLRSVVNTDVQSRSSATRLLSTDGASRRNASSAMRTMSEGRRPRRRDVRRSVRPNEAGRRTVI